MRTPWEKRLDRKGISGGVGQAVRSRLHADRRILDAAYKAASRESWRRRLAQDWRVTETEEWPR